MGEQVSVRILPGSKTAAEINPIPDRKSEKEFFSGSIEKIKNEVAANLRTFEIDYSDVPSTSKKLLLNGYLAGAILQAEVLESGKIRIL